MFPSPRTIETKVKSQKVHSEYMCLSHGACHNLKTLVNMMLLACITHDLISGLLAPSTYHPHSYTIDLEFRF